MLYQLNKITPISPPQIKSDSVGNTGTHTQRRTQPDIWRVPEERLLSHILNICGVTGVQV